MGTAQEPNCPLSIRCLPTKGSTRQMTMPAAGQGLPFPYGVPALLSAPGGREGAEQGEQDEGQPGQHNSSPSPRLCPRLAARPGREDGTRAELGSSQALVEFAPGLCHL